jgi:HPt (histidine-containing phosphotransfer) domain-containing protein
VGDGICRLDGGFRVIDWDRVADLRAEIGEADFEEVVEMFLCESDEVITRLRRGRPDPTLEAELHFLKGSALNLGFSQLAELCSKGEKAAEAGRAVDLGAIVSSYGATRKAFETGLRDRNAA